MAGNTGHNKPEMRGIISKKNMEWKLQNIDARTFKQHILIGCQHMSQTKFSLGSGLDHQLISSNISYLMKISSCQIIICLEQDMSFGEAKITLVCLFCMVVVFPFTQEARSIAEPLGFILLPVFTEQPRCWHELAAHMHVMPGSSSASFQYTNLSCLFFFSFLLLAQFQK